MTPLANGQPKASERDAREWREVVAAVAQEVENVIAPVTEGYARLPGDAINCLECAAAHLHAFDRAMAKIDGRRTASGGKYELVRVERAALQGQED